MEATLFDDLDLIPVEYEEWKEKQQKNIKYCGYLKYIERPKEGENKIFQHLCDEPDCKSCGPRIREEMYKALSKQGPMRKVTLTGTLQQMNDSRARLMRKYGGKNFVSTFGIDNISENKLSTEIDVLIKTDDEIGELYNEVQWSDVERWSQKSFNCKKSGNLHKSSISLPVAPREESDEKSIPISFEEWIIDPEHKSKVHQIEREVLAETQYLDPKTIEALKEALLIRRELREKKLTEQNIVILDKETIYTTIRMSEVNWKWVKNRLT